MFERIAIVNRGEAAMRLIHAVRELAARTSADIQVIALHTDVDRAATFVREADIAYDLGAATARPYLDLKVLERALVETRADAAWVGWGFVAEDPAFAELCERIGVTFVGPDAEAMRRLGDKIGAKLLAEEVGVPVAPWSRGPVETLDDALTMAARIGYPLMLKATAGGGGRGIRVVRDSAELGEAYERTSQEAVRAFGSGVVFLERLVTGARHVEVQVIADGRGTAWALGVRDCSVQRRNQKVIEESASPVLGGDQIAELKAAAERLAVRVGYRSAATVEFLYHPGTRSFAFLEVNTRLQVEHPITEATTGFDLVQAQLRIAAGERLHGRPPAERGHAIEARLNAEDPDRDFAPSPGRIVRLDLPAGPGIRVDTGVSEGDVIPGDFDSMIAKIIAYGQDRDEALGRLRRAMAQTTVIIDGGATNKSFVLDLLDQSEVIDASADTGWIDRVRGEGRLVARRHSAVALIAAAIGAYEGEESAGRHRLLSTASGGRPQAHHVGGRPVDLKLRGVGYQVRVARVGPHRFRVGVGRHQADVELDRFDRYTAHLRVNGVRYRVLAAIEGVAYTVEVNGVAHRISRDEGGVVRAPGPAIVVATPVAVEAEVESGAAVLVLESMKMETVIRAPFAARVKECAVLVGDQVESGAPLLRLEPIGATTTAQAGDTALADLELPAPATPAEPLRRGQEDLRGRLLGFDADPHDENAALAGYLTARAAATADDRRPLVEEVDLLLVFADLAELSRDRPASECFHTYLQCLDVDRAGVPPSFQDRLAAVLEHYGVTGLERTPQLEAAVFRIFLARQRASDGAAVVAALLRAWLSEPPPDTALHEPIGAVLERLVKVARHRFPAITDLARAVVFAWFAQPLLRRNRARVYAEVRGHLRHLDAHPDAPDRAARVAAMVRSTEPLVRLLGQRLARRESGHEVMLEVLTRRYYGNKGLTGVRHREVAGCAFVVADRGGSSVVTTAVRFDRLDRAVRGVAELAARAGAVHADVYVAWEGQPADFDETAAAVQEVIGRHPLPDSVRRITTTIAGRRGAVTHQHVTYRRGENGMAEDRLIRGLHPFIAQRMRLSRLSAFDLTRLPSADEEVYLFRAVARENPADDRLVAFAQVRDLTPLRDADRRLVALPTVEGTLGACLDSIRRALARRPSKARFPTNHIVVYVWPASDLTRADIDTIAARLLPEAAGADLEEILLIGRRRDPATGELEPIAVRVRFDATGEPQLGIGTPPGEPVRPLDDYRLSVLRSRSRGTVYPYELIGLLTGPAGRFTEYDLDEYGVLVPVERPRGRNTAAIVAGVASTPTARHPDGLTRVVLLGDPTKALGALSEAECARVIAALDLAAWMRVPVEWFALSAGARISMTSGTENMDWVAAALKRIVEFTQAGGEINVVVAGINVGAQPYWNAEATMLMHTRGILVMTPDSAMVLTGKRSLDFSGGVSAEDNFGIGGYDRVMGPNGQAQYWAPTLSAAREVVMAHYDHTYVVPGETAPRRAVTDDPSDRDVSVFPHSAEGSDFTTVGQIFSAEHNPERKKPFDIRTVMRALSDQDRPALERWAGMADAETAAVQDVHLGGIPVCLLGIESRPLPRRGFPPTDGPDSWTAGTLFPQSSKKAARAINAASGNRPLVVLANLSGFDGSPESMRKLQLEYGAEIGRAIVNFRGPIVFVVISRYHGGAFVVFSKALNPAMTVLALEGSFASVLGGAPAAAVVFSGEVDHRTGADPRVADLQARVAAAPGTERAALNAELAGIRSTVRAEKLGEVAAEFDRRHDIRRAVRVGSVDAVISPAELRPRVIRAIESSLKGTTT
ncbi:acetyl/propionyl-CoA carboxylase alpha subunit/acetyl-CoA carboxylase carboxyltransferase component [Actinoplanes tereljensis]|uniref:ATP-binding protein n=1 Tax=Paractinoplanes tereljensis TaxID=571912 RepID=UPI00194130DC|nr:carboxyl transferase domain-containing protein [Actinoplanes tereljensis]